MPVNESITTQVGATVTAVGIGAAIADTGALTAGDYRIIANLGSDGVGSLHAGIAIASICAEAFSPAPAAPPLS
jgi:hypothetical protein